MLTDLRYSCALCGEKFDDADDRRKHELRACRYTQRSGGPAARRATKPDLDQMDRSAFYSGGGFKGGRRR
jgi:hypothetical protein